MASRMGQAAHRPVISKEVWIYRFKRYGLYALVGAFLLNAAVLFFVQAGTLAGQAAELAAYEASIAGARQTQTSLNQRIEYQQTDEFIQRYARDQLGYVMPGEIRFVDEGN